jgi:6-phosphogluconate dehydrogenase
MQIALIGLGRMGANMARRLARGGHACIVYDLDADAVSALAAELGVTSIESGGPHEPARIPAQHDPGGRRHR